MIYSSCTTSFTNDTMNDVKIVQRTNLSGGKKKTLSTGKKFRNTNRRTCQCGVRR